MNMHNSQLSSKRKLQAEKENFSLAERTNETFNSEQAMNSGRISIGDSDYIVVLGTLPESVFSVAVFIYAVNSVQVFMRRRNRYSQSIQTIS